MADDVSIERQEFEQWIKIKSVVDAVALARPHTCLDILKARIRSGSLRLAARELIEFSDRGERRPAMWFVLLRPPGWIEHADDKFWDVGDQTVRVARDETGYAGTRVRTEIHGVRIEPNDVDALFVELGIKKDRTPPSTASHSADVQALLASVSKSLGGPPSPIPPPPPSEFFERHGRKAPDLLGDPVGEALKGQPPAGPTAEIANDDTPKRPVSAAVLKAWWEMCKAMKAADAWTVPDMQDYFHQWSDPL